MQWYGGARDKGRDVVGYKHTEAGREKWYIQAKRYQSIAFPTLRDELDKLADHAEETPGFAPDVVVFATACPVPPDAKDKATDHAREKGLPDPYYWDRMALDERLKAQPDTVAEFFGAPAAPVITTPFNLPADLADFTGRDADIAAVREQLAREGAVAISGVYGMGGIGKTALAVHVAHQLAAEGRFQDAQLYIDLKGTAPTPLDPAAALQSLLTAVLGPDPRRPADLDELARLWRAAIHGKDALLLLDNAAGAAQVRPLLPGSPTCAVLVTSRLRFPQPGAPLLDMDPMPLHEARNLLQTLAPRLDDESADQIAALCGCLPLALRVTGNYLALNEGVMPADYAQLLADEKERLSLLSEPDDPQLSVQAAIALSVDQLDPETRHAWALLSLFPAPFDIPAATALWQQPDENAAVDRLHALRNRSLLSYDPKSDRYYLHDLLRLAAAKDLEAVTEHQISAARDRLAQHYRNRAIEVKKTQRYLDLDPDWPHLRAALEYAAARHDDSSTMLLSDLVYALNNYLNVRGLAREWLTWCQQAAHACAKTGRRRDEGAHLGNLGQAYAALGEVRQAIKHYEAWVAISRGIGNRYAEAEGLNNLGNAYYRLGEPRMAIEYYEGALAIAREIGDRRNQANYLGNLGFAYHYLGAVRRAIEYHRDALHIARETGDARIAETTLGNFGIAWSNLGETGNAIKCYEAALAITRKIGDRPGEGHHLGNLGLAYARLGDTRKAIEYHEGALAVAREIGDRPGEGAQLGNLADAYKDLGEVLPDGDRPGAINYYEAALNMSREVGDRHGEAKALRDLGLAYAALDEVLPNGDRPGAIKCYEGALAIVRDIGNRHGEGIILGNLGIAYWRLGNLRQAIEYSEAALAIARDIGDRQSEANQLYNLALLTVRQWQPLRSGQLWLQALAVYQTIHNPHAQTMLRGMGRGCIEIAVLIGAILLLIALIIYALLAGSF